MTIAWRGKGVDEVGVMDGRPIIRIDPQYFRPTEVETLLGDASKAHRKLGWTPRTTFQDLVAEMAKEDLMQARRDELMRDNGYQTRRHYE